MARMSLSHEQETPQTHRWTNCLYTVPQCWLTKQQVASIIQYIQLSQSKNMHTKCNFILVVIQKNATAMPAYVTYLLLGTNREKGFHKIIKPEIHTLKEKILLSLVNDTRRGRA